MRPDQIERDLDRDHLRVLDLGPQERLDRRERVKRVMHQVITVGDLVEDRVDVSLGPEPPRREQRVLELGVTQAGQAEPVAVPHPLPRALDDVLLDLEVLDQPASINHAATAMRRMLSKSVARSWSETEAARANMATT